MVIQENDFPQEGSDIQGARVIDQGKREKINPMTQATVPAETNST